MNKKKLENFIVMKVVKILNSRKGFTLVELLIYMGLFSMFLLVLVEIFASVLELRAQSDATSYLEQDSRYLLARLSHDAARSSVVVTPASLGGSGAVLALTIGSDTFTYQLNNGALEVTNSLGTNRLNTSETSISAVNFTRIGSSTGKDTIRMQFTINSVSQDKSGAETKTFTTVVGRR